MLKSNFLHKKVVLVSFAFWGVEAHTLNNEQNDNRFVTQKTLGQFSSKCQQATPIPSNCHLSPKEAFFIVSTMFHVRFCHVHLV